MISKRKDSGFPYGCADAAAADGRRGSNVYEVNLWLWSFFPGKPGKPRLGGLSVEKTFERQVAAGEASKERAAEIRRRRKAGKAWFKVKEVFDSTCPEYIPVYSQYIQYYTGPIPAYTHFLLVTVWTAIDQIPTPVYHAMCIGCAYMQIPASETSPKVWKKRLNI